MIDADKDRFVQLDKPPRHKNTNVFELELTVEECRDFSLDTVITKVEEALDEAQAKVFGDEASESFLVIRITK